MSPRTRIITLNLGSQSIELAEFRSPAPGQLVLYGYRAREILVESTSELRRSQVVTVLREMMEELQIKGSSVNYTVAEESIFTRFLSLPPIKSEKIDQIISFEAQQNVPFPIKDVVWDYQLVSDAANNVQVILVAIKADLLDEINNAVEELGLRTSIVDLATMALYNAFHHSYGDLPGCSLLIDIGARTTNLLFIEPGKIFTRSIPIGGSTVTSAIAREFGEPFTAAELRKKRECSTGCLQGGDETGRVSKIVRATMARLHSELVRSINHYCTQQQGGVPERLFLSGGGASTPHLQEFFSEKLRLPIEFFNPLRNVTLAECLNADEVLRSRHLLGEPVGLALRSVGHCPMALNLLPAKVRRRQDLDRRLPWLIGTAACLLLTLLGWGTYFECAARVLHGRTEKMKEKISPLRRIELQLNEVLARTATIDKAAMPLLAAINDRSFWLQIIEELNAKLPKADIWITELVATSRGIPLGPPDSRGPRIETTRSSTPIARPGVDTGPTEDVIDGLLIQGLYLFNSKQQEVVVDYFRNLAESSWFTIDQKDQAKVMKPTTPTNTEWAFPYELRLSLRKPIKLP